MTSPSTQPPLTEPSNRPSSRMARWLPTRRGADPQVSMTVAMATRWPARAQPAAVARVARSSLISIPLPQQEGEHGDDQRRAPEDRRHAARLGRRDGTASGMAKSISGVETASARAGGTSARTSLASASAAAIGAAGASDSVLQPGEEAGGIALGGAFDQPRAQAAPACRRRSTSRHSAAGFPPRRRLRASPPPRPWRKPATPPLPSPTST